MQINNALLMLYSARISDIFTGGSDHPIDKIIGGIVFFVFLFWVCSDKEKKPQPKRSHTRDVNVESYISRKSDQFSAKKKELKTKYEGKRISEIVEKPPNEWIGNDGLPMTEGAITYWGPKYTVYVSKTGKALHRKQGCSGAIIPKNLCLCSGVKCSKCFKDTDTNREWVSKYYEIKKKSKKFNIHLVDDCTLQYKEDIHHCM